MSHSDRYPLPINPYDDDRWKPQPDDDYDEKGRLKKFGVIRIWK